MWKEFTSILSNLNNFHSLKVVDRVSETQLQVGENLKLNNLAVKGLTTSPDNIPFFYFVLAPQHLNTKKRDLNQQNRWPPYCQSRNIFTYLKLCIADATLTWYTLDMNCDFSSNNNFWARFLWWPFWILLGYFYYDRLIGMSRISFLAAILSWNFRFQISEVPTDLLHF